MSYEGSVQCICPEGHYWIEDAYHSSGVPECEDCGRFAAKTNSVDYTNGCEFDGKPCMCGYRDPIFSTTRTQDSQGGWFFPALGFGDVEIHPQNLPPAVQSWPWDDWTETT